MLRTMRGAGDRIGDVRAGVPVCWRSPLYTGGESAEQRLGSGADGACGQTGGRGPLAPRSPHEKEGRGTRCAQGPRGHSAIVVRCARPGEGPTRGYISPRSPPPHRLPYGISPSR